MYMYIRRHAARTVEGCEFKSQWILYFQDPLVTQHTMYLKAGIICSDYDFRIIGFGKFSIITRKKTHKKGSARRASTARTTDPLPKSPLHQTIHCARVGFITALMTKNVNICGN